jgi:hypothetical protein
MPYTISFSDSSDPQKPNIVVNDNIIDERLSVAFVGKNASNYSSSISKNFLHLLENFASPNEPANPVEGQLWYKSTIKNDVDGGLKIFDKTSWVPIGFIQKTPNDPNSLPSADIKVNNGDLYVDTANNQLYIKNGAKWRLIGPNTKESEETSAKLFSIIDNTNASRSVLGLYSNTNLMAIVSDRDFTPKSVITGFSSIKQGINLSTAKLRSTSNLNKFWGVSEKAESLIVGDSVISSNMFLRSDAFNTTTQGFAISNDNGLTIGSSGSLIMKVESGTTSANNSLIYNTSSGGKISFRLTTDNGPRTVLTVESGLTTPNGGVGINNLNPTQALDVVGNIKSNSSLLIYDTVSEDTSEYSIGANIVDSVTIGKDLVVGGNTSTGALTATTLIVTGQTDIDGNLFIKGQSKIYGNVSGNLTGLADSANYIVDGIQISTVPNNDIQITFDDPAGPQYIKVGALDSKNGALKLNLDPQFIGRKPSPSQDNSSNKDILLTTDLILISRNNKLFQLNGAQLSSRLSMPVGSIVIWSSTATVPNGYISCDGRSLPRDSYLTLMQALEATDYTDETGIKKFYVPNLSAPSGTIYIIFTGRFI